MTGMLQVIPEITHPQVYGCCSTGRVAYSSSIRSSCRESTHFYTKTNGTHIIIERGVVTIRAAGQVSHGL